MVGNTMRRSSNPGFIAMLEVNVQRVGAFKRKQLFVIGVW